MSHYADTRREHFSDVEVPLPTYEEVVAAEQNQHHIGFKTSVFNGPISGPSTALVATIESNERRREQEIELENLLRGVKGRNKALVFSSLVIAALLIAVFVLLNKQLHCMNRNDAYEKEAAEHYRTRTSYATCLDEKRHLGMEHIDCLKKVDSKKKEKNSCEKTVKEKKAIENEFRAVKSQLETLQRVNIKENKDKNIDIEKVLSNLSKSFESIEKIESIKSEDNKSKESPHDHLSEKRFQRILEEVVNRQSPFNELVKKYGPTSELTTADPKTMLSNLPRNFENSS